MKMLEDLENQHWIFQMTFATLVILLTLIILTVNSFRNISGF